MIDSRRVAPGDLFVAIGRGAEFAAQAFEHGAAAVLVPADAERALAALGGAVRERSRARVVAITGSTGKTSTKDILAALCAPHARVVAAEASFNNELGIPLTLCRIEPDTEIAIVEIGMRGLGQIEQACRFVRPHIGLITGVGPVHLELLGTVERVAQAKAEVLLRAGARWRRHRPGGRAAARALPSRERRAAPLRAGRLLVARLLRARRRESRAPSSRSRESGSSWSCR